MCDRYNVIELWLFKISYIFFNKIQREGIYFKLLKYNTSIHVLINII